MTEIERLRFYLRDSNCDAFSDVELAELLESTESFEEAVGLGWLLIASSLATSSTSGAVSERVIGKISEAYATPSANMSAGTAFQLSEYWFSKAGTHVARWFEYQPEGGFLGDVYTVLNALEAGTWGNTDYSRLYGLIGIGW